MRSKVSKITTTVLLVLCLAISMFATSVFAADSETVTKIDNCEKVLQEYTAEQASKYLAGDNTYPKMDGYLFAGWYTTKDIPEDDKEAVEYIIEDTVPENIDTVYALFVPNDVLTIKAQVSAHLLDDDATNDATAAIRFVTTVDSLLYKKVGFEVSYIDGDGNEKNATSASNTVYKQLYVADSSEVWEVTPAGTFCGVSEYFKACTVRNVPESNYETEFTVKPFWVTMNGDKVYGETATKSIAEGCIRKEVWISPNGADAYYYGSYNYPYLTLDYAIAHVKDGGTVHVKDDFTFGTDATWTAHGKNVIITGDDKDDAVETLDFSALSDLCINDGVTFRSVNLKFPAGGSNRVFAEGHKLVIEDTVGVTNTVQLFGGSASGSVESTNIEVYAGTYSAIYGASASKDVLGDTNVIVGAGVNPSADYTSHSYSNLLFGAGYKGTVYGNTNITVKSGAIFNYIYGGGDNAGATVVGSTNINFAGNAMAIYGGSRSGVNADTHLVVTGGNVYQLFGGSEGNSMTGNTDIQVLGGNVLRRIYGGCYNDYGVLSGWASTYQVTGHTSVTIGPEANATLSTDNDTGLLAVSRYKSTFSNEWGTLIFNDDMYNSLSSKIGSSYFTNNTAYHYLVKANAGGDVYSAGDCIYIKPDSGNSATVTIDGVVKHYTEGNSYYQLPSLSSSTSQEEIIVTFNATAATDFIASAEAKIATNTGYAYYATLEQAIAAAEKMDNATIENLSSKKLATISVADTENGTVTSSCKNCIAGTTVTLTVTPDTGYNLTSLSVTKDGAAVDVGTVTFAGGTYSFVAEEGNYTVEATFKPIIWKDTNAEWDVTGQYDGVIAIPSGDGDTSWLDSYSTEYGDFDLRLTLRDQDNSAGDYRAAVRLLFANGEYVTFSVTNAAASNDATTVYHLQNMGGSILNWKQSGYVLNDAQVAKLTGDEGIEFRIVRVKDIVNVYLDGVHAWEADLSTNSSGNASGVADLTTQIILRAYGNTGLSTNMEYSISDAPEMGEITINDTENGTVTANTTKYCVGDEVTITVTPDTNYDCTSFKVDGVEVALSEGFSGTYSFTASDISYEIDAEFTRKIFGDSTEWDVTGQYDGYLTIPSSDGDSGWVETIDKIYGDLDLTLVLRDQTQSDANYRAAVRLYYTNDQYISFTLTNDKADDDDPSLYELQTMGGTLYNWKDSGYDLTSDMVAKLTGEEGLEFRLVRIGNTANIYLDGIFAYSYDLTTSDEANSIENLMSSIVFRFYGNSGKDVTVPFTIGGAPETVTVNIADTTNGTISKDRPEYIVGEKITLTVAGDNCDDTDYTNDYYYDSLNINGEEVTVDSDGNYTFTATETTYDVTGSFAPSIFKSNQAASWDIMNQHKGVIYQKDAVTGNSPNLDLVGSRVNSDTSIIIKAGEDDFDEDGNFIDTGYENTEGKTVQAGDRTAISYWSSTATVGFGILLQTNGKYYVAHSASYNQYGSFYTLTEEETKLITEGDGIELRVIRIGSEAKIYLEDKYIMTYALPYGENEATTTFIKRWDDAGVRAPIEYKFSETIPETVALDIAENEGGTITTDWKNYLIGEDVTITVTPNDGYEFKSLKVAGEEVTVVDGTYTFTATEASYKVEASYKQISTIDIAETTNGTVTAGSDKYYVGDEVTLTVTPDTNYDCTSLKVDGVEVELSNGFSGTYTFTATESTHTVEATFTRKIFGDSADWDVTGQYDGYLTIPSSDGDSGWVETIDKTYGDLDLTLVLRDQTQSDANYRAAVRLYYTNDQYISFTLTNDKADDDDPSLYELQTMGGTIYSWKDSGYDLTSDMVAKLTGEEGLEFRLVRIGNTANIYLDGTFAYSYDLSITGEENSVENLTSSIVLRFYGNTGKDVTVPFTIGGAPETVTVNIADTTNGTITSDKTEYIAGEKVVLTVAGDKCDDTDYTNDYYYNSLNVNGEEVMVELDGTYTFRAEETNTVTGSFAPTIFKSNEAASWNIMNQHKGIIYQKSAVSGTSPWLYLVGTYVNSDTSIIVKAGEDDFDKDGNWIDSSGDRTGINYVGVTSNKNYGFSIILGTDGEYYIKPAGTENQYTDVIHEFTDEETKKIKEDGIELRVVKTGKTADIYLDGAYITSKELTNLSDGEATQVRIRRWDDGGVQVPIEFKFTEDDPTPVTLNFATVENGTFSGLKDYIVGEKVTIKAEGADGYACNYITVDGEEVELEADGTYTFKATKDSYEITGTFAESRFQTTNSWNVQGQYFGKLFAPSTLTGGTGWAISAGDYKEISAVAKDYLGGNSTFSMVECFSFENGEWVSIRLTDIDHENGAYVLQSQGDSLYGWTEHYALSEKEVKKVQGDGIEFKMIRVGTTIELYLDENKVATLDLTQDLYDESTKKYVTSESGITTGTAVNKGQIRMYGNTGYDVVVPYTLVEAEPVTISISDTANGIVVANSVAYYVGDTVTLTGTSKSGYA